MNNITALSQHPYKIGPSVMPMVHREKQIHRGSQVNVFQARLILEMGLRDEIWDSLFNLSFGQTTNSVLV